MGYVYIPIMNILKFIGLFCRNGRSNLWRDFLLLSFPLFRKTTNWFDKKSVIFSSPRGSCHGWLFLNPSRNTERTRLFCASLGYVSVEASLSRNQTVRLWRTFRRTASRRFFCLLCDVSMSACDLQLFVAFFRWAVASNNTSVIICPFQLAVGQETIRNYLHIVFACNSTIWYRSKKVAVVPSCFFKRLPIYFILIGPLIVDHDKRRCRHCETTAG